MIDPSLALANAHRADQTLKPGVASGDLDFPQKAVCAERRRELGAENLHGHLAVVLAIVGEVHRRHAALAELSLDPIAVGNGGGEPAQHLTHADGDSTGFWGDDRVLRQLKLRSRHS